MDMHSGGGQKLSWAYIYIEAPEKEAAIIFQNRFKRNPHRITCTCCGDDYSLSEETGGLEQATAYERGCRHAYFRPDGTECPDEEGWKSGKGTTPGYTSRYVEDGGGKYSFGRKYTPLAEYLKSKSVKVIYAKDIKPKERKGELNEEGYVWRD